MHYLLIYDAAPDYVQRRTEFRNAHLSLAWDAYDRGELVLAGALGDPVDGAALLFTGSSAEVASSFAKVDPYVVNGLVTTWSVREWITVVGENAATPVYPPSRKRARA